MKMGLPATEHAENRRTEGLAGCCFSCCASVTASACRTFDDISARNKAGDVSARHRTADLGRQSGPRGDTTTVATTSGERSSRRTTGNDGCWSAPWRQAPERTEDPLELVPRGVQGLREVNHSVLLECWRLPTLSQDRGETHGAAVRPFDASTPRQQPIRALERAPGGPSAPNSV